MHHKIRKILLNTLLVLLSIGISQGSNAQSTSFRQEQQRYPRVRNAYSERLASVTELLHHKGIDLGSMELFLRAFKHEQLLEVWARNHPSSDFQLITTYPFCTSSGDLGPKRREGDGQIPEGLYYIDRFNPVSAFHLSLGINYPNSSDRILANGASPGGDIFIHGNCVSIGCIPITDSKIQELYILCVEARKNGQIQIPVHIFPLNFAKNQLNDFIQRHTEYHAYSLFWQNLNTAFAYFEKHKRVPRHLVNNKGEYAVNP